MQLSFTFVYQLVSVNEPYRRYVGMTFDLEDRLARHNRREVPHTSKYAPWALEVAVKFQSREKAARFEHYLKSGSGRAFAKKHF